MERLLVSFSAGETSAFMAQWIQLHWYDRYDIRYVFANTGEENEETLLFADQCDRFFGLNLVWVEADVQHGKRKSSRARIVDYLSASRNGEPFEEVIKKYGLPGPKHPHCTRELKERPIQDYARQIGWDTGTYYTAIGIRNDEIDRMNEKAQKKKLLYPLITDVPMSKPDINTFWDQQPFRLQLKGYQGNCRVCWKKTLRKLLTIAQESPSQFYTFWDLETKYENFTPDGRKHNAAPPYRFYRDNLRVADILRLAKENDFEPFEDDSIVYSDNELNGHNLNLSTGCSESCEVFTQS